MTYISICFFKQKTAYEMRISDWSSDVCSSDLHDQLGLRALLRRGAGHAAIHADEGLALDAAAHRRPVQLAGAELVEEPQVHGAAGQHPVRSGVVERHHALRPEPGDCRGEDRKSTRLNSSH